MTARRLACSIRDFRLSVRLPIAARALPTRGAVRLLVFLGALFGAPFAPGQVQTPAGPASQGETEEDSDVELGPVPGEILIRPKVGARDATRALLLARNLVVWEEAKTSGLLRVGVPVGQEKAWLDWARDQVEVRYAQRNGRGAGGEVPNDTHFATQWYLENMVEPGADIGALEAWEESVGSASIVIAILDTGIDTDHPEFVGRVLPGGYDFVNDDDDPEADHPHGTQVAGVVAANANNEFGLVGVDHRCWILPIKMLDSALTGTTFDLVQSLEYCAAHPDVNIVSMSLVNFDESPALEEALELCRAAGKILVSCASNTGFGGADTSWPGASPATIAVGATTIHDVRAPFSGTGQAVDFVAPGFEIPVILHASFQDFWTTASGCSFATPVVAGTIGLLLARGEELGIGLLDQDQIYSLLIAGAADQVGSPFEDGPGWDPYFGHGRISAAQSLAKLGASRFIRGDANGDGDFDIGDAVQILVHLFEAVPAPCENALDVNDDESINIADAIAALHILFEGGPPPALPYPTCGGDFTSGPLGCILYSPCP